VAASLGPPPVLAAESSELAPSTAAASVSAAGPPSPDPAPWLEPLEPHPGSRSIQAAETALGARHLIDPCLAPSSR
jgi:hypothetical protein